MTSASPTDRRPPSLVNEWPGRVTRALVDLDALEDNVRQFVRLVKPARVMTVVKAAAYGHGAPATARAAARAGAGWLGVFTVSEGLALRQAGIELPILVLGPLQRSEVALACDAQLSLTVGSEHALAAVSEAGLRTPTRFHLEVDTGMHRAGVVPERVASVLDSAAAFQQLHFEGVFTHFANASHPGEPSALAQLERFRLVLADLESREMRPEIVHAANTAATISNAEAWFDMVRIGIGTYGYYPSRHRIPDLDLKPVLQLVSRVARVERVETGEGVGYDHTFITRRPTSLALVPIGYGDGISRRLSGRGNVLIHGRHAPIVGRISMDQMTVDVTDINDVSEGDEVVIIGAQREGSLSATDMADAVDTISYEVLTQLLPRVPRIYYRNLDGRRIIDGLEHEFSVV